MKRGLQLLLVVLLAYQTTFAQQAAKKTEPESNNSKPVATSSNSANDKEAAADLRKQRLTRIHSFAETIFGFRDSSTKALDLARLAVLLWQDDEPYSRQLFKSALDLSAPTSDLSATESRRMSSVRGQVISLIARRDSAWAKRLNNNATSSRDNFRVAYDLMDDDPQKAVEFADKSLGAGVDPGMYSLLLKLRAKDEATANALFLRTLSQLALASSFEPRELLFLGTYLFTYPGFDSTQPDTIAVTLVGHQMLPNLTADRPGIPPALIRAYLEVASNLLVRPLQNPEQREGAYVASRVLLAKAQKFAPDLADRLLGAMSALAGSIPPEYMQDSTYKYLARNERPLSEQLEEIEKLSFEVQRDARYMDIISTLYRQNDFQQAREMLLKIKDLDLRDKLTTLIGFGEARRSLEKGESVDKIEGAAGKLPEGLTRSILWLAIAQARARSGQAANTQGALNAAIESARRVDDAHRPFLILNAASQLARLNPELGHTALAEAISEFNKQKAENLAKVSWQERVDVAGAWRYFDIAIKNVDYRYEACLQPFAQADLEGVTNSVSRLSDQGQRGDALLAIAAVLLKM
jgi:hypothetical protein